MNNSSTGIREIKGLIVAPFTALKPNGDINLEKIELQAELFMRYKLSGAFVCGSTGEGLFLTTEERMQVADKWKQHIDDNLLLLVHVGHSQLSESMKLTRHAGAIGADGIGTMGPIGATSMTVQGLVDYCHQISMASPNTPFYYYHLPSQTGFMLDMYEFIQKASQQIPSFAGIKYTFENVDEYERCVSYSPKYSVLFGRDEIILKGLKAGARGAIGSFYNFSAPMFLELFQAFNSGQMEEAERLQEKVEKFAAIYFKHGGTVATGKAIMKITGLDCGPVRKDLAVFSPEQIMALKNDLDEMKFDEFSMKI